MAHSSVYFATERSDAPEGPNICPSWLAKSASDAPFGNTYTKIGMIRKLAWPLCEDDAQISEVFHIFRYTN